jgi:glycerol-3-phosphate acyltransferase PlsY
MTEWLLGLLGSYLIGSIPTAYLLVKRLKGVDVRTIGSGNVGATNATRVAGVWAGVAVFLIDAAKGLVAVWLIAPWSLASPSSTQRLACGMAAILGHNFPVFLRFRGGKGMATTIGVLLGTMPLVALGLLLVWAVAFAIARYVSVGSLAAAAALPALQLASGQSRSDVVIGAALALLIVVRHRSNISRLLQGTEHRAGKRAP